MAPAALGWVFRGTTMAAGLRHEAILQLDYLVRIVILSTRFRNFTLRNRSEGGRIHVSMWSAAVVLSGIEA